MTRFPRRPGIRAWVCSGIVLTCAVLPVWSQDPDPFDSGLDDFTPLPAAIGPDDPIPAPFSNLEENAAFLESGSSLSNLTPQQGTFLKQTVVERQRSFFDAANEAEESLKLARDSFERGLMPLSDYADQTQAALEVRLSIAGLQQDRKAQVSALSSHADLMRNAAKQLREFDQPASVGWEADAAYAELLVANADIRLAVARGDRAAFSAAVERSRVVAETHYDLRLADFDQGLASLPSLARAASYLSTDVGLPAGNRSNSPAEPSKFAEYLAKLEEVVAQTTELSELGAGVGREDRIHQANFELAKAAGQAGLQQKDLRSAIASFQTAAEASQVWFRSQTEFYGSGTASLREVTDAWWSRVEVSDLAQRAGLKPDAAMAKETEADLGELKKLIAATEDRQGRIAADVAYVKSLESLQGLWAREHAVAALARSKTEGVTKPASKSPRVLEINPNAEVAPAPDGTAPTSKEVEGTTPVVIDKSPETTIEIVRPKRAPKN